MYGTFLLHPAGVEFRDVPAATLGVGDRTDAPAMLRAAADYAAANGFAAAFPTFHEADYGQGLVFGLQLLPERTAAWRDVPADLLRRYSDPSTPMAVVLCRPSDVPAAPGSRARWEEFFLPGGADPANVVRYWNELSYGQYDAQGTMVFGWLDIGHTQAEIASFSGSQQRRQLAEWARAAAGRAGIDLGEFSQVVFGYNINADHGSVGGNSVVLAYADGRPFEPTFMFHEVGHALGLGHSSSQLDGTYGDRFDIMSAMNVWTFLDIRGRSAGPGAAAINLENLGWLHPSRVWRGWPYTAQTLTLSAVNRPDVEGWLAARLESVGGPVVYVEYRENTSWDAGLPGPRLLVHTRNTENGPEILGGGWAPAGALTPSQQVVVPMAPAPLAIRLESADTASSTATARVWALSGAPVRYGATLRLSHVATGCHLHSHLLSYGHPGTSGQQQVTCFAGTDDNDLWRVRGPNGQAEDFGAGRPVRHGDLLRLTHVLTGRNLHSHSGFPSPVTSQQEVTCFGDRGIGDDNDTWRVEAEDEGTWEAGERVRLIHVTTGVALHSHGGLSHPEWTADQQEVTGFPSRDDNDYWYAGDLLARDARYLSQSVPATIEVGQGRAVLVTMRNVGTDTWAPGSHRLGSQNPQDNSNWGLSRVDVPGPVSPGDSSTLQFHITAPALPGKVAFQWQMLHEGVAWFGDLTPVVRIAVVPPGGLTEVPEVLDMTRAQAARTLRTAELTPRFSGTGIWVVGQSPTAGTMVGRGTTVTCRLGSQK